MPKGEKDYLENRPKNLLFEKVTFALEKKGGGRRDERQSKAGGEGSGERVLVSQPYRKPSLVGSGVMAPTKSPYGRLRRSVGGNLGHRSHEHA